MKSHYLLLEMGLIPRSLLRSSAPISRLKKYPRACSGWDFLFVISFLLLSLFLLSCTTKKDISIQTSSEDIKIVVEIADTIEERAVGLMYRTTMEEDQGMLFVFDDIKERIFWMKNTKIPLDILFLDENGTIIDIKENFQLCVADPCEHYYSKPAMYALEVNAGFVVENGVAVGDKMDLEEIK